MIRKKFIFYDRKRVRIKKVGRLLLTLSLALLLISFAIETSINYFIIFDQQKIEKLRSVKETVDIISERKKDIIEIEGYGPFVKLVERENGPFLIRESIKKPNLVILTFDDGPDPIFTPLLLDKLKEMRVKAVFFMVGEQMVRYPDIVKRVLDEGHEVGVHTFYHPGDYSELYNNIDQLSYEIDYPQKVLVALTGYKTNIMRAPNWGAENQITLNNLLLVTKAAYRGYDVLTSTVDSQDWREINPDTITRYSTKFDGSQVILLHDGGGNRQVTIDALPQLIENYKNKGYEISSLNGITPLNDSVMQKASYKELLMSKFAYNSYWLKVYYPKVLRLVYITALGITVVSMFFILIFATIQFIRDLLKRNKKEYKGLVSIIIPARNEEGSIEKTVSSALNSDYDNYEVIVVDNNSTDNTSKKLERFTINPKFRLSFERKLGKYAALNKGIRIANGEVIIVIDADTQMLPDTVRKLVRAFRDKKVGATAGNLKVGNQVNILTKVQTIEYIVGLNLERRAYDLFSAMPVIPGALGAWRKEAVKKAGGFTSDTLAEDADLAIRVQRIGYKASYISDAIAFTEAPETLKQFTKQRQRWIYGIFQVLFKNKDIYFRPKYGFLGTILLPYMSIVQTPFLILGLLIDIVAILTLFHNPIQVITFYLIFLLVQYFLTIIAFIYGRETRFYLLIYVPLVRTYYQILWYWNLYTSVVRIIKGVYLPWNKLSHLGSVVVYQIGEASSVPELVESKEDSGVGNISYMSSGIPPIRQKQIPE